MTAWDLLTTNSSLPSGTAWEHLNAQEGGGEGPAFIIYEETTVTLDSDLEVTLEPDYLVTIDQELAISLEEEDLSVLSNPLNVTIND